MFRGFVVGCVGSGIIMSTLGLILSERLGGGITVGGLAVGVATINGILLSSRQILSSIGSPLMGSLLDRVGVARAQRYIFLGATAVLFLAGLFPEIVVLLLVVVFFFICETTLRIALTVEAGIRGPKAYSVLSTATDAGAAVGPILAWTVFDLISNSQVLFLIGGALYAASTVFSFRSTCRSEKSSGSGLL
jgi:MFS family permease